MEILDTQIHNMMFRESEHKVITRSDKVCHGCPDNLQTVKEIHFIPKLYARKTISKMGPEVPWPDSYHSRAANGPPGPNAPKY